jgi:ATP/maltotriose-dependent transcriptional regulator MalT
MNSQTVHRSLREVIIDLRNELDESRSEVARLIAQLDEERTARRVAEHELAATIVPQAGEQFDLSQTERRVVALIAAGLDNHEIARRLHVSERTIESHSRRIYARLDIPSGCNKRVFTALTMQEAA